MCVHLCVYMCVYIYIFYNYALYIYKYMYIHMSNVLKLYREPGDATPIMESHSMEKNMEHDVERRKDFLSTINSMRG